MKHLVDFHALLKAAVETEQPTTNVVFDAEYFYRKDGQGSVTANRVVVAETPEDAGTFLPPVILSRAPPEVGIERQNVAIEVWAYDGSAPTDKAKQFIALKALAQCVWRLRHGSGNIQYLGGIGLQPSARGETARRMA